MESIIIRQISGKRSAQTDQFPVGSFQELLAGRDESAAIRFDPTGDDLVSRRHMQIVPDPTSPGNFQVVDLQSRNGTFLNRHRLYAPTRLNHGDLLQLGPGGPEFRFELDPPPNSMAKATREISAQDFQVPRGGTPTREMSFVPPVSSSMAAPQIVADAPRPIGRATVERMLGESFNRVQGESKKALWATMAAALVLLLIGGGFYLHLRSNAQETMDLAKQQQVLMQQMDEQVKQQPAAMDKAFSQVQEQLKKSNQREQELSRFIASQHAATHGPVPAAAGVVSAGAGQSGPAPIVRQAPAAAAEQNPYTQGLRAVMATWDGGQHDQAMQALQQLIASDTRRYEGFMLAGNYDSASGLYPDALLAYEQATELAPEAVKPKLQAAVQHLQAQMQQSASR
jgi:pSer/pThr/pTyr-binding forkhead associated (FHA) protein/cytochrome c-type biogenesis protein CcmH/NrfG